MLNRTQIQQNFDKALDIAYKSDSFIKSGDEVKNLLKQTLPSEHQLKFEYIWNIAYEEGHSSGLPNTVNWAIKLIRLVLKFV